MENVYYILILVTVFLLALVAFLGLYQKQLSSPKFTSKKEEPEIIKSNTMEDTDEII